MLIRKRTCLSSYLPTSIFVIILCFATPSFALQKQQASLNLSIKEKVDIIVSILGTSFALFTLWRGIEQYKKDQRWKKAEFVAKEIKEFKSDPITKNVMLMLDWNQREIKLSPNENIIFDIDLVLCKALQPKTYLNEQGGFTSQEALIRDHFDAFLDYLERFEAFIEAGLVGEKDFDPYLSYWFNIIGNRDSGRKDHKFYEIFWQYIDSFGYTKVQKLMSRYGYFIKPTTNTV